MRKYHQGFYRPKNPQKYEGDPTNIVYRSGWELKFMKWADTHPQVVKWKSEEFHIQYVNPVDGRVRRYFPDFYLELADGRKIVVEIKPKAQTVPPQASNRKTKQYVEKVMTYAVNQAKWQSARQFCEQRKWEFKVLTEDQLFV